MRQHLPGVRLSRPRTDSTGGAELGRAALESPGKLWVLLQKTPELTESAGDPESPVSVGVSGLASTLWHFRPSTCSVWRCVCLFHFPSGGPAAHNPPHPPRSPHSSVPAARWLGGLRPLGQRPSESLLQGHCCPRGPGPGVGAPGASVWCFSEWVCLSHGPGSMLHKISLERGLQDGSEWCAVSTELEKPKGQTEAGLGGLQAGSPMPLSSSASLLTPHVSGTLLHCFENTSSFLKGSGRAYVVSPSTLAISKVQGTQNPDKHVCVWVLVF